MSTLKTNRIENLTTTDGGISINNSGNVGIGVSSALTPLDVVKSGDNVVSRFSNGTRGLEIAATSTGGSLQTYNATQTIDIKTFGSTGSDIKFSTNNTERFRVTSDGKIGIGTSTPGSMLDVSKSEPGGLVQQKLLNTSTSANSNSNNFIYVNGAGAGDPFTTWTVGGVTSWSMGIDNSDSDKLVINNGSNLNSSLIAIDTSGRVGISTSSAAAPLHVDGNNGAKNIVLSRDGGVSGRRPFGFGISGPTDANFRISSSSDTSGANAFDNSLIDITSDGKVGIGTTSPNYDLQVHDSSGSSTIQLTNGTVGSTSADGARITGSTSGTLWFENLENAATVFTTNDTERVRIPSSGGMSIGTSSSPTCLTQASALRLGNNTLGSHTITNLSTTVTNISSGAGIGGLAFVQLYNTSNGAQYVGLVMWRYGVVSVVSESNATGLAINFSVSGATLRLATGSGTVSGSIITMQS